MQCTPPAAVREHRTGNSNDLASGVLVGDDREHRGVGIGARRRHEHRVVEPYRFTYGTGSNRLFPTRAYGSTAISTTSIPAASNRRRLSRDRMVRVRLVVTTLEDRRAPGR